MVEKRGNLSILVFVFLVLIVFIVLSSDVYAGCCYGEDVQDFCQDVFNQQECDTISLFGGSNTFVGTQCADLDDCQFVCCCSSDKGTDVSLPRFRCDESAGNTIVANANSCSTACQNVYVECPYKDCNSVNPLDYASVGCNCTSGLQLDADNPYCCAASGQKFSLKGDCPSVCVNEHNYVIVGYVLDENRIPMKDVMVYLDNELSNKTGISGKFSFDSLTEMKTYYLTTSKLNYEQTEAVITVSITSSTLENEDYNPKNITLKIAEAGQVEDCDTNIDDDDDGFFNKCDVDCNGIKNIISMKNNPIILLSETNCNNKKEGTEHEIDDDCDGFANCQDSDCKNDPACKASGVCGNNKKENYNVNNASFVEQCDGTDSELCPGKCIAKGLPSECTCPIECGNTLLQIPYEQCDAKYDASGKLVAGNDLACTYGCVTVKDAAQNPNLKACDCKPKVAACGNNLIEGDEDCDGGLSGLCKAGCCGPNDPLPCHPCECKQTFRCGDDKVDPLEQCDAKYDASGILLESGTDSRCQEFKSQEEAILGVGNSKYLGTCNPRNSPYECQCKLKCSVVKQSDKNKININLDPIIPEQHLLPVELNWDFSATGSISPPFCQPDKTDVLRCEVPDEDISSEQSFDERKTNAQDYCSDSDDWVSVAINLKTDSFQDSLVQPNKVLCYKLRSYYSGSNLFVESNMQCIPIGMEQCFKFSSDFCSYNDVGRKVWQTRCDTNNFIEKFNDCSTIDPSNPFSFVCVGPYQDRETKCKYQSPCYKCSDPLGMFYDDENKINIQDVDAANNPFETEVLCPELDTCHFDYSKSIVDFYDECSKIKSCYDYKSKFACQEEDVKLDGNLVELGDKCHVGGTLTNDDGNTCVWVESEHREFGIGVCKPVDPNLQECGKCNDPFNKFFGKCNQDMCRRFGDCFYSADNNLCIDKKDVGCGDYGTRTDCINYDVNIPATDFVVDANYDSNKNRVSGSHKNISQSNDYLTLGKCKWLETQGRCIKDADGDDIKDCKNTETFEECKRDFKAPITIFPDLDLLPAKGKVLFSALDDVSSSVDVQTMHSVYPKDGDYIYPNSLTENNEIDINIENSGDYNISYYSFDEASNLEIIHHKQVYLDANAPEITVTYKYNSYEIDGQDDKWRSDINFTFSAVDAENDEVICSTDLFYLNDYGDEVLAQSDTSTSVSLVGGLSEDVVSEDTYTEPLLIKYTNLRDNYYVFRYSCKDESNNNKEGAMWVNIDGDKSLTLIMVDDMSVPKTIRLGTDKTVKFSLQTQQKAECKYSCIRSVTNYYDMPEENKFDKNTEEKYHYIDSEEYNQDLFNAMCNVRCLFVGENKVYGNNADRIIFTVDDVAPVTTPSTKDKFYHLNNENDKKDVSLDCNDLPVNANPESFGCKETYYCKGENCNPNILYSGPIEFKERNILRYYSVDIGGNIEEVKRTDVKISRESPKVNITVIDVLTDEEAERVTRLGSPAYLIKIESSKPLKRIHYFNFTINGLEFEIKRPNYMDDDMMVWQSVLVLSPLKHRNLEGEAKFKIYYSDNEEYQTGEIEKGEYFFLDTKAPDAPILKPFEDDYYTMYSTMKRISGKYYTNKPLLYLTGHTSSDDQLLDVSFYLGDFEYQDKRYQTYDKHSNNNLSGIKLKSDEIVNQNEINNDINVMADSYASGFNFIGKYIDLFGRVDYGHFKQLYLTIPTPSNELIEIIPNLQKPLTKSLDIGDETKIYEKEILKEWFYPEINFNAGNNIMRLRAEENFYVKSDYTPNYNVFFDSSAPEVAEIYYQVGEKKYPLIGSTINNRDAKIVVKVKELKQGSRIDDQTSLLSINDGTREYSSLNHLSYFSKQNYFDIGYNNYLINSLSSTDQFFGLLQYGIIKLNISVSDYAGNYLSENYDIAYLPNVPSGPSSFLVLNANDYGYSYFIEGIPNVVEVVFDSPIYNFGATCLGQELEYETLDNKRFIVSTTALPQLVQRSSAVFERTYSESDNLRGKIVHFEYDASDVGASDFNFQPLKYYKILIDDVYLMKTRADINGKIRFDYKILGKEVYNIKIQEVDEQVYPIKFTGKNRDNNEDPAGFWTYTLVVDSVSPSIIVDELIKTKSDENILIRAKVENENFDLIAKINISNYSNNNDEVPAQQFYMDQLSNDEFAYKLFIPEGVKHGDKINYVVIIEDRAGKIGHSENGIIEIDNSRPGVIVENIETGPGKYIKKTVYDKDEFYVKDYDNKINITGVINGTAPVHVWHGATKIDLVLNDKKEFMLPLNLTSFPNTLYPNNLIFVIGGKDPYEVVLYSDNEFPNVPSISFEDSIGGIVDSTMPVALVEYDEMVNLIDYRVMNASNNVVINKDQISFETEDNKEFLLKINKPMADGDYLFEIKAKDELGNEQLFYSNQVFRVNAGETQIYLIYPKHGAVTTPSFLLKIGTTRYEKCRYTSINPIDQTGLYNYNNEKLMYSFTPQDLKLKPLEHEGQYSIVTSNPNNPLYVVCTDGVETIHKLFTNLRYDNVKPEITSATLSRPIIDYRPTETEFIIKTNEKTICKYASNQEYESFDEGKEYDSMHWFDHESVETESSYKVEHRQLIRVSQEEKEYIYHVICEDLAGLKSEVADIEFEVKNQVLSIEVIEPPKVTSDVKFNFKIKTSQIAECYYKNHKDQNSLLNLMELNYEDMTHTEYFSEYSYWEEPFASGQHSYYFQCIQAAASSLTGYRKVVELVYNFTVDTTPPLLTKFNIPQDYFCALSDGKYSLTFSLEGMDPESSVDGFNYTLVDSNYNPVIDEKYALVSQKTIILSGLTLDKSLGYKLGAKAVNPASMLASSQAFNYSTLMFVYGADSTKCLNDQTGPKITVKKTATGQGIRVDLECEDENGCSSKNYNYDVAASKEECTPTIPYDFVEGVLITENSYICWSVKDNLDNPSEGSWLIEIKDTDKDGVPDELDIKCPNTPAGERAITQGENIGCAESEIKIIVDETDTDGDGVYDKDDVCPKTPEGDDVEVIGKYKGCSDDQIDYLDDDDDGVINMDDKCPDTSYGLEVDVDGCPEKEIPKSTSIWPWMIGSIISLVLVGGGYFAYAKYPQMFGNLLGGSNKVQQSGRTMVSSAGINVPVKELPKKYVEQQLALKRRQQLKQKQKSIMQRSKELFSKFSRKTLSKDSKTSNITKVNNKTNNPNLKKDSKESKSFDELERLIREARSKRK